jgi:DNA-binding winged helix-turn-helix (wHTH) protein
VTPSSRFRFGDFVLSPRQRLLLRSGAPLPLIPKYFDLLCLLVERRREAVSKDEIFAQVWSDVVVSDGALSQAVRTLRRTLGDSSREPRFIRTVSRHGYQFVFPEVVEEHDEGALSVNARPESRNTADVPTVDEIETLVDRLMDGATSPDHRWQDARDAAERLHAVGTRDALDEIARRPHRAMALAIMRDARWTVPGAGRVPLDASATAALVRLRLVEVGRTVARRWAGAALAVAIGGVLAGFAGGLVLAAQPASTATPRSALALAAIGALAGAIGGGGIGAGLAAAEAVARSRRGLALALCGAASGAVVAGIAQATLQALAEGLLGGRASVDAGLVEGFAIGAAAGLGYAVATPQPPGGGLAAPTGSRRIAAAALVAAFTAAGAIVLAVSGRTLVGGLVNDIARSAPDAQLALAPLGRLVGEPDFGAVTRVLLSAFEGAVFGYSLTWGLTSRPRESRTSH